MNEEEFNRLSSELKALSTRIPVRWGRIQNDGTDDKVNMFECHSIDQLEARLNGLSHEVRNYFLRRWFMWKCAQCDEWLFYSQEGVLENPNPRDQAWDVEFLGRHDWRFDVKGTILPRQLRPEVNEILRDPTSMIAFNYERQSQGVRNALQNRLFIVHHSYGDLDSGEMRLRTSWDFKSRAYKKYVNILRENPAHRFHQYGDVKADVIFLLEKRNGEFLLYVSSTGINP